MMADSVSEILMSNGIMSSIREQLRSQVSQAILKEFSGDVNFNTLMLKKTEFLKSAHGAVLIDIVDNFLTIFGFSATLSAFKNGTTCLMS